MGNDNNTNWLQLLMELERGEYEMRSQPGDVETRKDLDWMLRHPGEAANITEVRAKRQAWETKVRREAARMKQEQQIAREMAAREALEAYALANLDRLPIAINRERVKKVRGPKDLKCPCGAELPEAWIVLLEGAADIKARQDNVLAGQGSPFYRIVTHKCHKCQETAVIHCQGIVL